MITYLVILQIKFKILQLRSFDLQLNICIPFERKQLTRTSQFFLNMDDQETNQGCILLNSLPNEDPTFLRISKKLVNERLMPMPMPMPMSNWAIPKRNWLALQS
jgi:hypothetical protein